MKEKNRIKGVTILEEGCLLSIAFIIGYEEKEIPALIPQLEGMKIKLPRFCEVFTTTLN